jgi:hypothetical protein
MKINNLNWINIDNFNEIKNWKFRYIQNRHYKPLE